MGGDLGFRETPKYVACGEEDCGSHYGHFGQFRPALSDAWNEKRNPDDAEHEASAKHDCEIQERGANGL